MAQNKAPLKWPGFGGLMLSGNPAKRPTGTARACDNYRVMPGRWLRMRTGRKALAAPRDISDMGEVIEFMPFRANSTHGSAKHLVRAMDGVVPSYWEMNTADWTFTRLTDSYPAEIFNIRNSLGWAALDDALIFGNGYGTRQNGVYPASSATRSIPWLTRWDPTNERRFFGLHYHQTATTDKVYVPSMKREVPTSGLSVVVDGTGLNYNTIASGAPIDLYAGLHNTRSGHYSNGALVSATLFTVGAQTIHVSGFSSIQAPYHSTNERDEIKIVFYATLPGGKVPYLIMNASMNGPFTVTYGSSSTVDLSITNSDPDGWVTDKTKEMPVNNFPPRQMRDICYVNGRLIGIPFNYDGIQQVGYEYEILQADMSGVCWSYSYGDQRRIQFAGNPLESWPPTNFAPCPSGERPLRCAPAPDGISVLVLTASQSYLLREQSDGLMEWISLSTAHGINYQSLRTLAVGRRGICWVTQRNQIAMIAPDMNLRIISGNYDSLIRKQDLLAGGFIYDPANEVDRYEVSWLNQAPADVAANWTGTTPARTLCHDFITGEAYTTTDNHVPFTAFAEIADSSGRIYNLAAGIDTSARAEIYAREGIPGDTEDYRVMTFDEDITARSPMVVTDREIPDATYETNWFTPDDTQRVQITQVDLVGDVAESVQLSGQRPVSIETFRDFNAVVADSGELMQIEPIDQSTKEPAYENNYARLKPVSQHGIHWKFRLEHQGHSTDEGDFYPTPDTDGANTRNFHGAIVDMQILTGEGQNRK